MENTQTKLSVKKVKAYNKVLDVINNSSTKHHQDVAYIMIERFGNLFFDESLTEILLETANKTFGYTD
tara:strand:+ start:27236 stop:27439 length:204 start_codon:yes stop_codon:yes gene_type:complete